jgi:hypothetical protein
MHLATMQANELETWLPSVLHEAYFRWHSNLHTNVLAMPTPSLAGSCSDTRSAEPQQLGRSGQLGLARLHAAARCLLAAGLVTGPEATTPVGIWPARLLQLKMAARHMGRCCLRILCLRMIHMRVSISAVVDTKKLWSLFSL